MSIVTEQATVYRAPTARRRFLTKKAAIKAEAVALIKRKHPTERAETDSSTGYCTDPGWHWRELPRSDVLLRRVCQLVNKP